MGEQSFFLVLQNAAELNGASNYVNEDKKFLLS